MNITATQLKILQAAAEHRHGFVITTTAVGRGPMGGLIREGQRDQKAALALSAAGLLVRESVDSSVVARSGYGVTVRNTVWSITDTGRAAVAEAMPY